MKTQIDLAVGINRNIVECKDTFVYRVLPYPSIVLIET